MALSQYTKSTDIISVLGTTPQERGLTTEEFKAKFDQFAKEFVEWFNTVHLQEGNAHLAETVTEVINIKTAYGAGQGGDDGQILNDIMAILGYAPATIIFPKGAYNLATTVKVEANKKLIFMEGAIINITADVDAFIIEGNMSGIEGANIVAPADYTKAVITITADDGHRWCQYVKRFFIQGTNRKGTGIKIAPQGTSGVMNTLIKDGQLRYFENAIEFNFASPAWTGGGTVCDVWQDLNINGINFINGGPNRWVFERFRGQYGTGTEYHIKDIKGSMNRFVDCFQWDGMNVSIHNTARYTVIDGNMITQPRGTARIRDEGFRTNIRAMLPSLVNSSENKYIQEKENFIGAAISSRWVKDVSSGATIDTHIDTATPNKICAKLTTGAEADSKAALTMGGKLLFQRYNESVVSWEFKLSSISKVIVRMGFKTLANPNTYSAHWGLENDGTNFKAFSGASTLDSITSIVADTAWHTAQIIKYSESKILFHLDGQFVGEFPGISAGMELFFEVQTKEAAAKNLLISDVYMRTGVY